MAAVSRSLSDKWLALKRAKRSKEKACEREREIDSVLTRALIDLFLKRAFAFALLCSVVSCVSERERAFAFFRDKWLGLACLRSVRSER